MSKFVRLYRTAFSLAACAPGKCALPKDTHCICELCGRWANVGLARGWRGSAPPPKGSESVRKGGARYARSQTRQMAFFPPSSPWFVLPWPDRVVKANRARRRWQPAQRMSANVFSFSLPFFVDVALWRVFRGSASLAEFIRRAFEPAHTVALCILCDGVVYVSIVELCARVSQNAQLTRKQWQPQTAWKRERTWTSQQSWRSFSALKWARSRR